jgi:hypothetical protein
MAWQPKDVWQRWRSINRARYWRKTNWANLKRATLVRWTLEQRAWPQSYLHECMADLSGELSTATKTHKPKKPIPMQKAIR